MWASSGFENKILLEHTQAIYLLITYLLLIPATRRELNTYAGVCVACKLKIFFSHLDKEVCHPLTMIVVCVFLRIKLSEVWF